MEEIFYLSVFLVLLAVALGVIGIVQIVKMADKRSRYRAMTKAQVVGVTGPASFALSYKVNDQALTVNVQKTTQKQGPVAGEWVDLQYNPMNPQDVYVRQLAGSKSLVFCIVAFILAGIFFIAGALVMVVFIFSL